MTKEEIESDIEIACDYLKSDVTIWNSGGGDLSLCVDAAVHFGAYLVCSYLVMPKRVIGIFSN